MGIRSKTIIAIVGVILTISGCYYYYFIQKRDENRHLLIDCKKDLVTTIVTTLTKEIDTRYNARIKSFANYQTEIIENFAARDREQLYRRTLPVYELLRRENQYFDHINFILPDQTVFLRMHDPDSYGDEEQGSCLVMSELQGEGNDAVSGFVYGNCGLLYRVVHPVHYHGKFIGNVLFGVRMGAFIQNIRQGHAMHTALALQAEVAAQSGGVQHPGVASGKYIIYDFDDPFFRDSRDATRLTGEEQEIIHENQVHYVFPSYIIRDTRGEEIGRILQSLELTPIVDSYRSDIVRLFIITFTVLVVASLILYLAFSKLYGQLVALNDMLAQKNQDLTAASERLEEEVAARTSELAKANEKLQEEIDLRHEANQSLSRSIEEWQSTFDAIADPVTILDRNLEIVIANRAAHEMLSRDDQEIVGRTCHELFAGSPNRCPSCPANDVFTKGIHKEYEVEHDFLGKSLMVSCSPIYDGSEIMGYVHTAKDITQEKILKKQLSQAQKMEAIATLAGGIAHDFNNILGAILGNADLLLFRLTSKGPDQKQVRPELKIEDVEAHVQAIKKAGNRAKDLVGQILAFSRQGKAQRQNAIITPVIKEAVKLLRASLPANIEINAALDSAICHIYADLTQVHQVFMNLCTNAAQAMPEGGILNVSLKVFEAGAEDKKRYPDIKPGRYVALAVEDTGHGMTHEVMERIFDPFFTTRDVGEGTGMGLAVIHGIISSHDGVLDVRSQVNVGSTFTVFFPCVNEQQDGGEDIILGMPRGSEKILFVDDEEDIVRMTSRMLEYLGYTVYPAGSADQALAMLGQESFEVDLVITDYSMPGISGIEMAKKVGTLRPGLPVMLCSGFSESTVFDEDARRVVRKFMSKPLDMKKLAFAIREILPAPAEK